MVTMKRKINEEKDRYGSFDSVIEIDDVKNRSYGASQQAVPAPAFKKRSDIMPKINPEHSQKRVEAISTKTKLLLSVYVTVAVILAAVVIGTGIAITNATNKTKGLEEAINALSSTVSEQNATISMLSNEDYLTGYAVNELDMEKVTTFVEIELIPLLEPATYTPPTSIFDKIARFISSIFS